MAACAKILDIMLDNFYLLNKLQFVQILQYRQIIVNTKMVDHILKISRAGVFDIRCFNWNTAIIVFMKG